MPHPQDWKGGQMPCGSGKGGGEGGHSWNWLLHVPVQIWQVFHSIYDLHVLKAYVPEQIWQVFP